MAHVFDEGDVAVKRAVSAAIASVKVCGRKIGICGQAPSDHAEYVEYLVRQGIDSISLALDALLKGLARIHAAEST